jgi:hypothetical protein
MAYEYSQADQVMRKVGEDYRPLSKATIFERIRDWQPGPHMLHKTALVRFAGAQFPGSPEGIGNTDQDRLSRALYWFDKGRLRAHRKAGPQTLYLVAGNINEMNGRKQARRSAEDGVSSATPAIAWGAGGATLTWRT